MLESNSLLLILFIVALFIGWLIARFPPKELWQRFSRRSWHQSYQRGLQFLLNEQADHAIESLVSTWSVNSENFDLHNALANMLRRKGEVARAIAIHTNLLTVSKTSAFTPSQLRLATTELARDFIHAGLLDRAERLLINVVNSSKEIEEAALQLLLRIYQKEKEWEKAIMVAEQLYPHDKISVNDRTLYAGKQAKDIAHFYCEIATDSLKQDDFILAEQAINQALKKDKSSARATLLEAELHFERSNDELAINALKRLPSQDAKLLVEALPLLENYLQYQPALSLALLTQWQQNYPSVALEKAIFEIMLITDHDHAGAQLEVYLRQRPTLKGLDFFIDAQNKIEWPQERGLTDVSRENIALVHRLVKDVLKGKLSYQCNKCGFSGNQLHWQCPQCHQWDTIRRLRGPESD